MGRYILHRLMQMVPLLFGITFLVFAIVNLTPGSPVTRYQFNPRARPADIERIKSNLGLDDPWPVRYVRWLSNVVRGDFGISMINYTPITTRIMTVLPNTLLLTVSSLIFALIFSIPLGIYAAVKRNSLFDNLVTIGSVAAYAVPTFWLGLMLIILFAVKFNEWGGIWGDLALPVGGTRDLRGESGFWDRVQHLILPTVSLGLVQLAGWTRYIRASMLEVIRQDYIRTASAKGLRHRTVLYAHAFRNALLPLVTLVGLTLPDLFAGAFIVENIFAWNGMGRLTVNAALDKDYTLIMATTVVFAVLTLIANLIADIMYAVLDPRIRFD